MLGIDSDELADCFIVMQQCGLDRLTRSRQPLMIEDKGTMKRANGDGNGLNDGLIISCLEQESANLGTKAVFGMKLEEF